VSPSVVGLRFPLAWLLHRWEGGVPVPTLACVLTLVGLLVAREGIAIRNLLKPPERLPMPALLDLAKPDLPILVSDPLTYLPLDYYADSRLRDRLVFVGDVDQAAKRIRTDSAERTVVAMAGMMPLQARNYDTYVRLHRTFYVYWAGQRVDWVLHQLKEDGMRVELVGKGQGDEMLFLATRGAQ
jgi:hypothetical protein